jgi:ABC-type dipeptide/oligopeptide/nickel transport system permease component
VPLAILLGLIAARYAGRWPDKLISGITLTTISLPEFVAAYFVIYLLTQLKSRSSSPSPWSFRAWASGRSCTPSPCR